jgi:copper homeostasis protein
MSGREHSSPNSANPNGRDKDQAPKEKDQVLIEVCVDSVASAVAAERGGAARVELCSDLAEGGITPSTGLIELVREKISIGLQVMIRPRGGDFFYSEDEIEIMRRDIAAAKKLGADGVVLGVLCANGGIDIDRTRKLIEFARPLNVTFHRAFDMSADLFRALDEICSAGADRLLTSGGEQLCDQGADMIARLVRAADGRITIMAVGGIGHSNAANIIDRTNVGEIHVGLSSPLASPMLYRNPRVSMGSVPDREYQRAQVLEDSVRKLHHAVSLAKSKA